MSTTGQVPPPKFLTVEPRGPHTATVIFIHGLGDTGHGWQPVAQQLSRSSTLSHIKWILPHAKEISVTVNMNMTMPGWYDIYSFARDDFLSTTRREDKVGMLEARDSIVSLIKDEVAAGIPENRIVVGGFSQGAVVALLVALTGGPNLSGLAVASGYMPLPSEIKDLSKDVSALPVFWAHGRNDPLIPFQAAEASMSIARARLGMKTAEPGSTVGIEFHSYPMEHSACEEEIVALGQWLGRVLP